MEELNAIYERMRAIFAEEAGFVPNDGCDAMVRLYALASEVQSLLAQADWVLDQSFPQTAVGQYLDYHAETRALTRLPAAKAAGVLRFSAPSAAVTDYEIDAGSVAMTSGGVRFETTKEGDACKGRNVCGCAGERRGGGGERQRHRGRDPSDVRVSGGHHAVHKS